MTLTQLTYVAAVDTHRHFGRAAEHCGVTQPTLSAQIKKLEGELGATLFDRSRQPVVPTAVGARVVARARAALREAARVRAAVVEGDDEVSGELRLGVIPTLASSLLPLVTGPFGERHPHVSVVIREMTTEAVLDGLGADRLDAGLIATDERRAGVATRRLFAEPFVAYVSPDHRLAGTAEVSAADLAPSDVWLLSEGHCFRDQVVPLCGAADGGPGPAGRRVQFESGSLETLRRMVDRAGGLTLLPRLATLYLGAGEAARVRPLAPPVPQREVRVAYGRAHLKRALVEAYVGAVLDVVGAVRESEGLDLAV